MPGGKGNIRPEDNPKPFTSEYQPANRGRKPLVTTQLLNQLQEAGYENVTKEDVRRVYSLLLGMPVPELQKMVTTHGDAVPAIFKITARQILSKNGFDAIEKILDRLHGRAPGSPEVPDETPHLTRARVLLIEVPDNPLLRGEDVDYEELTSQQKKLPTQNE